MNSKELFQETRKHPYVAPEVTQVEFRTERGFVASNPMIEVRTSGRDAWDFAPDYQSEGRSFGRDAWGYAPDYQNESRSMGSDAW